MTPTSAETWVFYPVAAVLVAVAVLLLVVMAKSRRIAGNDVFVASRWTRGNRLFPTQVAITPASVSQVKPQWLGREEHSIHLGHVASVTTDTGPLFSDVTIETSGGSEPIVCHGHRRSDAVRMKELIERYQAEQREVRVSRRRPPPRVLSASVPSARRPSRPRRGSAATADGSRPPREGERDHGPVLAGTGTEPGRGRDGGEAPE